MLRLPDTQEEDSLLALCMQTATEWVEQQTSRTLLQKTWRLTHQNTHFVLPMGPVQESNIQEVTFGRTTLTPKDYTCTVRGVSLHIEIPFPRFSWRVPTVTVTYKAGFGETPDKVPAVYRSAVLSAISHMLAQIQQGLAPTLSDYKPDWGLTGIRDYTGYF